MKAKNLLGQKFGRLSVLSKTDMRSPGGAIIWECQCECGTIKKIRSDHLVSGKTLSCGCLRSKGEEKISQLLKENQIPFIKEYTFSNLKSPLGGALRFDFAIFDSNNQLLYLIEYDGYQHSLADNKGWHSIERLEKTKESDNQKTLYCQQNNIRIPYTLLPILEISHLQIER